MPADLVAQLESVPGAAQVWPLVPKSSQRALLEWLSQAKKEATRVDRLGRLAQSLVRGETPVMPLSAKVKAVSSAGAEARGKAPATSKPRVASRLPDPSPSGV